MERNRRRIGSIRVYSSKVLGVLLVAAMMLSATVSAFAEDSAIWEEGSTQTAQPQVQVNGELLSFRDAEPLVVNGRIMIPLVAFMEAVGGEAAWNSAEKSIAITAGQKRLKMVLQSTQLEIWQGEERTVVEMDVAPLAKNGRTYVPVKWIADVLGYAVSWDSWDRTVIVIDLDRIYGRAEEDFSLLNKLLHQVKDEQTTVQKQYDLKLKGDVAYSSYGRDYGGSLDVQGVLTGLVRGDKAETALRGTLTGQMSTQEGRTTMGISLDTSMEMEVRADLESGEIYVKGSIFDDAYWLPQEEKDSWIHMKLDELYGESELDIAGVLELLGFRQSMGIGDLMRMLNGEDEDYLDVDSYAHMKSQYDMMKVLLGDQAFVKSGRTYTAKLDSETIERALRESLKGYGGVMGSLSDIIALDVPEEGVIDGVLSLTEAADGSLDSYRLQMKVDMDSTQFAEESVAGRLEITATGGKQGGELNAYLGFKPYGEVRLTLTQREQSVSRLPETTPPSGSRVLEYNQLYDQLYDRMYDYLITAAPAN